MNLTSLFDHAIAQKASDIHLATGETPCFRVSGKLTRLDLPALDRESFVDLLNPVLSSDSWIRIESGHPVERQIVHEDLNFAMIAFRASVDGLSATFRIIPADVPDLDKIGDGAMPLMERIVDAPRGLVLIAGPVGSGKCTTACSIVDRINATKPARIFVIERGPNYRFQSKMGLVSRLQVGQDFETYEHALETVLRADLDVVCIDDLGTAEALRQMLILAETGHLVVANLHADSVSDALRRLYHSAGSDSDAFHIALAQNLVVITVQRLLLKAEGVGRIAAYEWLTTSPDVKQALLAGDLKRIEELQLIDKDCRTLDAALDNLIQTGKITEETAKPHRKE